MRSTGVDSAGLQRACDDGLGRDVAVSGDGDLSNDTRSCAARNSGQRRRNCCLDETATFQTIHQILTSKANDWAGSD